MDFVSAHARRDPGGRHGRRTGSSRIPLVVRAKLEIASAAHAHGKVPSHCVVTEFNDVDAMRAAANRAARRVRLHAHVEHPPRPDPPDPRGLRARRAPDSNWRPKSSRPPSAADWAPVSFDGTLHDRASYRHFWQVLSRAHATGRALPTEALEWFAPLLLTNAIPERTEPMKTIALIAAAAFALPLAAMAQKTEADAKPPPSRRCKERCQGQGASQRTQKVAAQAACSKKVEEAQPISDETDVNAVLTPKTWRSRSACITGSINCELGANVTIIRTTRSPVLQSRRMARRATACIRSEAAPAPSGWKTPGPKRCGCSWATSRC